MKDTTTSELPIEACIAVVHQISVSDVKTASLVFITHLHDLVRPFEKLTVSKLPFERPTIRLLSERDGTDQLQMRGCRLLFSENDFSAYNVRASRRTTQESVCSSLFLCPHFLPDQILQRLSRLGQLITPDVQLLRTVPGKRYSHAYLSSSSEYR